MYNSSIVEYVLHPLALVAIDQALQSGRSVDQALIEEVAESLYRRHRAERRGRVKERTFQSLPPSERGKYRSLVRDAIEVLKESRLFRGRL